jgi:hypothetical protein
MSTRYVLTFTPTGPGPAPAIRVRRLLKHALRSCGLRCVSALEVDEARGSSAPLLTGDDTIDSELYAIDQPDDTDPSNPIDCSADAVERFRETAQVRELYARDPDLIDRDETP